MRTHARHRGDHSEEKKAYAFLPARVHGCCTLCSERHDNETLTERRGAFDRFRVGGFVKETPFPPQVKRAVNMTQLRGNFRGNLS